MCCARHHKPQHQLPLRQRLHRRHRSCTCPSSTPFTTQFFNQFCPTERDLAFVTCSGPDMMFPKGSPAVWEIDSLEGTWFRKYKIVQIHHLGRNFHCNYTITTTTPSSISSSSSTFSTTSSSSMSSTTFTHCILPADHLCR